jgi:hypothetical protein
MEVKTKPWARLISTTGTCSPINLIETPNLIGSHVSNNTKIADLAPFAASLEAVDDFSAKLTAFTDTVAVNSSEVPIDTSQRVMNGDIVLLDKRKIGYGAESPSFFFVILHDHLKRPSPPENALVKPSVTRVLTKPDPPIKQTSELPKEPEKQTISEELKCGICLELIHNCVTLTDCLHNFCGGCISDWLKNKTCPLCKAPITKAKKNSQLNNIVKALLSSHKTLGRPAEEIQDLEARDKFKHATEIVLKRKSKPVEDDLEFDDDEDDEYDDDEYYSFHSSDEDSEDSYLNCPECSNRREGEGFLCSPDQLHLECASCQRFFPNRSATHPQRCGICQVAFCSMYLPDCEGDVLLRALKDHPFETHLSPNIFRGNQPDLQVGER